MRRIQCQSLTKDLTKELSGTKLDPQRIKEAVHMVYNDGSYHDMRVGFFPPDVETARQEISKICGS